MPKIVVYQTAPVWFVKNECFIAKIDVYRSLLASDRVIGWDIKMTATPNWWSPFFIAIQQQGKILSPIRLCSGKMWKSNVKNIFSYNFPRYPVGVKSYRVVLKLLRNHLRPVNKTAPNEKYFKRQSDTCLIINILSLWLKWKKKKIRRNKNYVTYQKMIILI